MIQILKVLWARISDFFFPKDYFSWQTVVYMGVFSLAMSWVARLSGTLRITENLIATAGWIFFALGAGWFLEEKKIRPFGISLSPWVAGAIVCLYTFNLLPFGTFPMALMSWPLASVAIAAVPQFLTWEFRPKVPRPPVRQQLILMLLIALLFSSWFQFYFRLQSWFGDYPSLIADDFSNSGFVYRLAGQTEDRAKGISLLTTTKIEVERILNDAPWPRVERWLLNVNDQMAQIEPQVSNALDGSLEKGLWQLRARPRTLDNGYALDLLALWLGPSADPDGYYFETTCTIYPRSRSSSSSNNPSSLPPTGTVQTTQMAEVNCGLATPKRSGRPDLTLS